MCSLRSSAHPVAKVYRALYRVITPLSITETRAEPGGAGDGAPRSKMRQALDPGQLLCRPNPVAPECPVASTRRPQQGERGNNKRKLKEQRQKRQKGIRTGQNEAHDKRDHFY
ncbi:UNVERIFIED_CONTAM: hypothetical protein K2H54_027814 [Gekko kuhli]